MKHQWLLLIVALVVVAAVRSVIFVDEAEFVIVTQFGQPLETLCEAGLHFKLPYQSTIRIDKRLQIYAPRPSEFLADEKKNVDLAVFVCWRVGNRVDEVQNEPQLFLKTVNDFAGAETRIHDLVWSELAAKVGQNKLEALVSSDKETHKLDDLVNEVTKSCADWAKPHYGIEIVDVRLKRIGMPAQVRDSVFQRMRAERSRMARRYRAEGEEEALKKRATADKDKTVILAEAYAQAEKTRGEAEAEATRIYGNAHQQDAKFYELLRTLEAYKKFLDEKTTVLLSADSELLKYLTGSPMLKEEKRD